eukprot:TRINITY_DN3511_c0_g1_i16.p10 TRINITY_DN3511_c0_g1~~TRINITY_DN3511_c0_g1_i16.p10  ORF type:complete len:121 (-),score=0.28 TRINITY_DN3511_c0_g1_i16:2762-3124(-)
MFPIVYLYKNYQCVGKVSPASQKQCNFSEVKKPHLKIPEFFWWQNFGLFKKKNTATKQFQISWNAVHKFGGVPNNYKCSKVKCLLYVKLRHKFYECLLYILCCQHHRQQSCFLFMTTTLS